MLEGFQQPLPVQVKLRCLEQQQQYKGQQAGHLQEPRDPAQGPGEAQQGEAHGVTASGSLSVPNCG